jgi:hypothetical protein
MESCSNRQFGSWFVVGIIVLAPVYIYSTASNEWFDRPAKPIGDGLCYESIGFSLFQGNGFRENYADPEWRAPFEDLPPYEDFLYRAGQRDLAGTSRPPMLPVIIAAVYSVFGRGPVGYMTIRVFAAVCLALAGALATGLTAQLLANRTHQKIVVALGAITTLGLSASTRTLKDYTSDFLTEPLALLLAELLFVVVILHCERGQRSDKKAPFINYPKPTSWIWAVAVGLIIGLMILARSLFVFWVPGLLFLLAMSLADAAPNRIRIVLIVWLSTLTVCAPWWIHNCQVLQKAMPLGTQGPIALLGGYSQEAYDDGGNWSPTPENLLRAQLGGTPAFRLAGNDTERELLVVDAAKKDLYDWILKNQRLMPMLVIKRAITHWNPYWGRAAVWKLLILLGLIWAVFYAGPNRWWLLGLPALSTIVVMALYETGGRFLVPLYGLLFTLGGLGVSGWWARRTD